MQTAAPADPLDVAVSQRVIDVEVVRGQFWMLSHIDDNRSVGSELIAIAVNQAKVALAALLLKICFQSRVLAEKTLTLVSSLCPRELDAARCHDPRLERCCQ